MEIEDGNTKVHTEVFLKLIDVSEKEYMVPELRTGLRFRMRSKDFSNICRDLFKISKIVRIGYFEKGIHFSVEHEIPEGFICGSADGILEWIENSESSEEGEAESQKEEVKEIETVAEHKIETDAQMPLGYEEMPQFSLDFINNFIKGATFSQDVEIHLPSGEDSGPLMIKYDIGGTGSVKYFLAKRIPGKQDWTPGTSRIIVMTEPI